MFCSGVESLSFKSLAGQIGHNVTNGSPPLQYFFKGAAFPRRNKKEIDPADSLHASAYYSEYNERFDLNVKPSH